MHQMKILEISDDPKNIQQEFPSEEYAEFMHMITHTDSLANKYSNRNDKPLPSTSQAGRIFVENLQVPSLDWRKEIIFEYKGIEYNFEYRSNRTVLDGIRQILMNRNITKDFILESVKDTSNQRQYTDMYDSDWWRNVEKNLPIGAHVIYMSPKLFWTAVIITRRNKTDAKILLGYIPSIEYCSTSEKKSAQYHSVTRELFHCALATILQPLRVLSYTGIYLYVNKIFKWFYPFLALIISDWPEAYAMNTIYGSSNALHPCHFCLVDRDSMNNIHIKKEDIIIRDENNTKLLYVKKIFEAVSGFTSETYELLHKTNVKQPYCMTNKHHINKQMQLILRGFEKLKSCIYDYFQNIEEWSIQDIENETIKINVSEFAYLDNSQDHIIITGRKVKNQASISHRLMPDFSLFDLCIRATPNYYGQACFSDICVEMDESEQDDYLTDNGLCYAKVLLIIQVLSTKLEKNLELALVYWYDFAYYNRDDNDTQHRDDHDNHHDNLYFYKCAILKHVDHYTLIPIASIANIVHIIPKFDMSNVFM
ncbi:unnamed protein product [Rhizophagus irregularis]|nr:unnamed protein product [Rhizophagus irregularis]